MRKRIMQVPVDEALVKDLDELSKKLRRSRSDLIRDACAHYVAVTEEVELDKAYVESYRTIPEDPRLGELGLKLLGELFPGEEW
jgi:metal-responsive CopG/Arc/MetJ family transcriptional regulator